MKRLTKFQIKGLFGSKDVTLPVTGDALILVGPNGIGKSSVINIFYFFVSRQWNRLLEYQFDEIAVWFGDLEIRAAREDISGLSSYLKVLEGLDPSSRVGMFVEKLKRSNLLEEFLSKPKLSLSERTHIASVIGSTSDEIRHLHAYFFRRYAGGEDDLFGGLGIKLESQLSEYITSRTLYLPTYRRIEKNLKYIFPDIEDRVGTHYRTMPPNRFARSSTHYVDLVSFGMEDVRANIESKTRYLRDYSLAQFNNLSGLYLRDVIKGTADEYSTSKIAKLDPDGLSAILARVSEQVLSSEDKQHLRLKITEIKGKRRTSVDVNDRYLAHYFSRLMSANVDISNQEADISAFVNVCNAYLQPGKSMVYDETRFLVSIKDDSGKEIDLSVLSSGEKQVVSLFSHLYLDDTRDQIVIIDEPELSLSVPWQKRFLTDILDSGKCKFLLSVTHSPFIYQNRLERRAVDLRRRIKETKRTYND